MIKADLLANPSPAPSAQEQVRRPARALVAVYLAGLNAADGSRNCLVLLAHRARVARRRGG